ncbi:Fic family protein [Rhizobium brockwellii]|uniref:Fic family protein n=1 Tax=Rhizobium brockwellii TaxID=3019932 RepID=A0ABU3YX12_9HYPH|nr:Fic family protein [Rhizobium brockwellii]MDV4183396.1 Fic family protein [Rhizobium brockwellii]MDV4190359.1 Fic family protein [Rhizobium brockwellii]
MSGAIAPCPGNWEYEHVVNFNEYLTSRSTRILQVLRSADNTQKESFATDTRLLHGALFFGLTPPYFDYYAGHYRGEKFRCLDAYEVQVSGDPRVGHQAVTVPMEMVQMGLQVGNVVNQLDFHFGVPSKIFSKEDKLLRAIELAAALFVYFLEVHPYANGNGHMGRFLLQSLLGRYGLYFNANFNMHPRPKDPAYTSAISQYRNGNKGPLHVLLLNCL